MSTAMTTPAPAARSPSRHATSRSIDYVRSSASRYARIVSLVAAAHENRSDAAARAAAPSRCLSSSSASSRSTAAAAQPDRAEARAVPSRRPRPHRRARRPPSRPPVARAPSPRARRRRSPRAATGKRRLQHARSSRRAHSAGRSRPPPARGLAAARRRRSRAAGRSVASSSSATPFSSESRPTKSTCGGSSGSPTAAGSVDPARNDPNLARAEHSGVLCKRLRRAEHEPSAPYEASRRPAHAPRELDVRPPELEDEGLPRPAGRQRRRQPVRMDEVGVAGSATCSPGIRDEEGGNEQRLPGSPPQIPDDAVTVGEPEVTE